MPEYLSPGVYVEEVSTGTKPIEGVSTSTAGMVGVTERGPENIPILVTSNGDYRRRFGGDLGFADVTDGAGRIHGYLPHSVQGFFQNEGRRNYIVRALPDDASHAARFLFNRGHTAAVESTLLRTAPQDSGTLVNQPLLYAINTGVLNNGDWIRIGEGSRAEYRQLADSSVEEMHIALSFPLSLSYGAATSIAPLAREILEDGGSDIAAYTLAADADRGANRLLLNANDAAHAAQLIAAGSAFLEMGDPGIAEYIRIESATLLPANQLQVSLATPLQLNYDTSIVINVTLIDANITLPTDALNSAASAGDTLVYPDDAVIASTYPGTPRDEQLIIIDDSGGTGNVEIRRLGNLGQLTLDVGAYVDYPVSTRVQRVSMADDQQTITLAPAPTADLFNVDSIGNIEAGMTLAVQGYTGLATVQSVNGLELRLTADLQIGGIATAPNPGDGVTIATRLSAGASAGNVVLSLANRVGLEVGDVLRIGTGPDQEYVTVARINGNRGVAPDAGSVVTTLPLREHYAADTLVLHQQQPLIDTAQQAAFTTLAAGENTRTLFVSDDSSYLAAPDGFRADDIVLISTSTGAQSYHRLAADAVNTATRSIELNEALTFSHDMGSAIAEREALMTVQALDRGAWGNRLRVAVEDAETSLVQAQLTNINPPQVISLSNFTGVEAGTIVELVDPDTGALIDEPLKVLSVDRASGEVELDGSGLSVAHIAAHNTAQMAGQSLAVRSREFSLSVFLVQRPDPAVPSRNDTVIDSETFLVSMDPRHSLYIHTVIGTTWTAGNDNDDDDNPLRRWDRRSAGQSNYIRVRDIAAGNNALLDSIRLGPEALVDALDNGQLRAARLPLHEGDDAIATIMSTAQGDTIYLGTNSDEPEQRSGIHALRNIQDISIVAVPGQTSVGVQQALINHCENDRYRFAILDAQGPDRDTLADVQFQRQSFDSKYAALYHPWLTIPEPLPANVANIRQLPIPPSGHMAGLYARVDNTRGVHKAPANEVLRGITGLKRSLNKREHDILNPFPKNINVIRDFRNNNRGLRAWGARCITSDSQYKYVNVRRLMIFLEASMDRGLQWVVFEPNAEDLWARVRRSLTNFLTVVWRNGALEGTTVEQAFFVKCDRTTMTQTDINDGRLICEIGVAPVKPAEFVILRIGQMTASAR
ncbi:MAG: phage tail sheath C-terminal domain-containing protein [Pseudomonadota bacterium]